MSTSAIFGRIAIAWRMVSYGVGEPARPNALTRLLERTAQQFTVRCREHAHPSPTEPTPRLAVAPPQARPNSFL
jgi:hypothetical protein